MASGLTTYAQQRVLRQLFGNVSFTNPTAWYLGYSTTTPNEDGTGATEPTDPAYARKPLDNNTSNWQDLLSGTGRQNAVEVNWNSATTPQGTATYLVIYDAPTGGNMWYYTNFTVAKPLTVDDVLRAAVGSIQVRIQPTT